MFPRYGTFNLRIIENFRRVLYEMKPQPRPALNAGECAAHAKQKKRYQGRV